jgi:putative mycofactocin binding protein MftB
MRPEPFGALLYHFGTRKLSFLKNQTVLAVVRSLDDHPTARSACAAAGVAEAELPVYCRALAALRDSRMITERIAP